MPHHQAEQVHSPQSNKHKRYPTLSSVHPTTARLPCNWRLSIRGSKGKEVKVKVKVKGEVKIEGSQIALQKKKEQGTNKIASAGQMLRALNTRKTGKHKVLFYFMALESIGFVPLLNQDIAVIDYFRREERFVDIVYCSSARLCCK